MDQHVKVGVAPDSWGVWFADDPRQTPWSRYLDEAARTSAAWTELGPFGYMPTDAATLRGELSSRGLGLAAGGAMFDLEDALAWEHERDDVVRMCVLLAELGAGTLLLIDDLYTDQRTGEPRAAQTLEAAQWRQLVDTTLRVCETADSHGLRVAFHPHAQCHVQHEGEIERLLDDADGLELCLDVGHHAYCGGDPVAFYRRHHARISHLHLKSVDAAVRERVLAEGIPFSAAVADGVFVEPAEGAVDFPALCEAIAESGFVGFAIVEQDCDPTEPDRPLPIAIRTLEFLAALGLR
jgi:inosose dehydratase